MVIGILDSYLSPVELNVSKSTSQLFFWFCSGNSDTSTPELKPKGGLMLLKLGPFSSFHTHYLSWISVLFSESPM